MKIYVTEVLMAIESFSCCKTMHSEEKMKIEFSRESHSYFCRCTSDAIFFIFRKGVGYSKIEHVNTS